VPTKKQVRRRRAVLGLLVAASLLLLTAYFGESASSPLHTVQRGIVAVLTPVEDGASKVLSPFRSVANWVSGTFNARSQNANLNHQVTELKAKLAIADAAATQNGQLRGLVGLDSITNISKSNPVAASVIGTDPSLWYRQILVATGSDNGVNVNDPVIAGADCKQAAANGCINDGGLVGKVTFVSPDSSIVTLLTAPSFAVSAQVTDARGNADTGLLVPEAGNPGTMLLTNLPPQVSLSGGEEVYTSGFRDTAEPSVASLYPAAIPIGTVVPNVNQDTLTNDHEVEVTPEVNMRYVDVVQILTQVTPKTQTAFVPGG
jgi:rod shape-determining protein MreC